MPTLEIFDTVRVKDGSITGTVERTHLDNASEAIEISDFLIIAHIEVPQGVIIEFATSGGIPPRGYVLVLATEDAKGAFLAAEDDLDLLNRSFDTGDSVKRKDGLVGTVIDVSDNYNICPIWLHRGSQIQHVSVQPDASSLCIANVPSTELKAAEGVFEETFVSMDNWLGTVEETHIDVIIRLENDSVVTITDPSDLFVPITDLDKPLVHFPDFDNISRPHALSAFGGWSSVLATDHPRIGTFVVTSHSTIRSGRWLAGSFDRASPPQGRVIAVVPRSLLVDWLICNPFVPLQAKDIRRPSEKINVYTNIETYCRGDDLRKNEDLITVDLTSSIEANTSAPDSSAQRFNGLGGLHPEIRAGDCVRFRDPTAAAVKYHNRERSNRLFNRINEDLTGGWDMNVFSVASKAQTVKVLWHDGSVSATNSNDLSKFSSFEEDLRPTDIVVDRSGLKMRIPESAENPSTETYIFTDFNEMKFFEQPHDLQPRKVGIIQSVDARESVATVRWYEDPQLLLLDAGSYLSQSSYFGPIGNVVEEVSTYEIMKFPALHRDYGHLVVIPPPSLSRATYEIVRRRENQRLSRVVSNLWGSRGGAGYANSILHGARERVRSRGILDTITQASKTSTDDVCNVDWAGEVVALGLDGNITVRLSGATPCRDEIVSFDRVLAIIDLDNLSGNPEWLSDDGSPIYLEDVSDAATISESIEYEGGERLDNDADDENWESAEEDVSQPDGDIDITDATRAGDSAIHEQPPPVLATVSHTKPNFQGLLTFPTDTAPPLFAVLDTPIPPDQHRTARLQPSSSSPFLKRIHYEHKILTSSLPTSIYVRTYESNLSLLRCLIIGPTDTPYEHAPFVIDLALPAQYPSQPPVAFFHAWNSGLGRINPNLYEEGKICLSLLGTWPGKESKEQWSTEATILQLLLSLQGLVLVKKPFYNEAGFEEYINKKDYETEALQYSEKAHVMARGFVKHALTQPPGGLDDILSWLYFPPVPSDGLFSRVLERGKLLMEASMQIRNQSNQEATQDLLLDGAGCTGSEAFLRPLSKGALVMLRRLLDELEDCLKNTPGERALAATLDGRRRRKDHSVEEGKEC